MTDMQLFAFVIMPVVVAILGWLLAFWARWVTPK
jgi:hypothetical protein